MEPEFVNIRAEVAADQDAIRHVNRLAFGQDDKARLVDALREPAYAEAFRKAAQQAAERLDPQRIAAQLEEFAR